MYYYDFSKRENDIAELQTMLRTVYMCHGAPYKNVASDGKFGSGTEEAIRIFQKEKGLPVTGVADLVTWESLCLEYDKCLLKLKNRACISPFPKVAGAAVRIGERSDLVLIIQIMLNELRVICDCYGYIPQNGKYGMAEANAVRELQRICSLPETGEVDGATWDAIAEKYNKLV